MLAESGGMCCEKKNIYKYYFMQKRELKVKMESLNYNNVCVVIPVYTHKFSEYEIISLKQCSDVLHRYRKVFISPDNLNNEDIMEQYGIDDTVCFDGSYFQNRDGYNRLMLSRIFYEKFSGYDYILIHQLDAFVFKDELKYWCEKGYDYIGAPWLKMKAPYKGILNEYLVGWKNAYISRKVRQIIYPKRRVGNGGFSLRKVSKFQDVLVKLHVMAEKFPFNEDLFWSVVVPDHLPFKFKKPGIRTAARFSVESNPRLAHKISKTKLPFGCHAWEVHDIEYWKDVFASVGVTI